MFKDMPDTNGHFGRYGGRFVPETLMPLIIELENAYNNVKGDPSFKEELSYYLENYAGRPTPLYFAEKLSDRLGGPKIYLKREDLCHTGSHKINNCLGQALLARKMGKTRLIAETGAGQHGVATATVAALFGMECVVYMGEEDVERQSLNVFRMQLLGAKVVPVTSGSRTLKDAINETMRDWMSHVDDTYYLLGSVMGPHPYPMMVRDFQSVIGKEAKGQIMEAEGRLPEQLVACVGGGSNSIGLFHPFIGDEVKMTGVEAGGLGLATDKNSATLSVGSEGVLHGSRSYLLQTDTGQIRATHSISAGLDYPGVGPEHSYLRETGRADYVSVTDKEAIEGFRLLSATEGIIPALESAHAIAYLKKLAKEMSRDQLVIVCLSGRGDKDVEVVKEYLNISKKKGKK